MFKLSNLNISAKIKRFKELINSTYSFAQSGIWQIRSSELRGYKAFRIQFLRVIVLTVRGYYSDKIALHASALTYFSLLSIVPVIAMAFGIAQGFGLQATLEQELKKALPGQEVVTEQILSFARSLLADTQGGAIAGVGLIILIWTVIRLLDNIETSFNDIWEISKARGYERKFTDYMTIIIFAPILIIIASSSNIFITTQIKTITQSSELLQIFSPLILFGLQFIPYTLIWLVMTVLYIIMPNTTVKIKSALIAGILAGTLYQFTQWAYISFQVGVSRYNTIYGSFAALPLFLIWLQLSWFIVLLGAEVSFAIQNVNKYEFKEAETNMSFSLRRALAVAVTHIIVRRFVNGEPPLSIKKIAQVLKIPSSFVRHSVELLTHCKILNEIHSESETEEFYQPALDTQLLSLSFVIASIENYGKHPGFELSDSKVFMEVKNKMDNMYQKIIDSDSNVLLKDI